MNGLKPEVYEKVECVANKFIYSNPEGTFGILLAKNGKEEIRLKGDICSIDIEEHIEALGKWEINPKYGKTFFVQEYSVKRPSSINGIKSYISENLYGVGPSLAEKIVQKFGKDTLQIIDKNPERLLEISGFGKAKFDEAMEQWREKESTREVMLALANYGITHNLAKRIYKAWGDRTLDMLQSNPFQLTEIERIGFKKADEVALRMGMPMADPRRVEAGIQYVLQTAKEKDGHTFLQLPELLSTTRTTLGIEESAENIYNIVKKLAKSGLLVIEPSFHNGDRQVFLPAMWKKENRLAEKIRSMIEQGPVFKKKAELPKENIKVTEHQWQAVQVTLSSRVSILTGNPGTGKTTACKVLCDTIDNMGLKIMLTAPTGKAAKRITEATGHDAQTIHRLLESQRFGGFARNANNPLECDVLVVDEASMIDLPLAESLFQAIGDWTHVVLVGDVDQLPPLGVGKVLQDLIQSKKVPITRLKEVFRQAKCSMIIQAAYSINNGKAPEDDPKEVSKLLSAHDKVEEDFYWVKRKDNEKIKDFVVQFATERIPNKYGYDPFEDIQVLAPQRNTFVGVDAFNIELQAKLNPEGKPFGDKGFRIGDKLLNTQNNYTHDVMNGEFAFVKSFDADNKMVTLDMEERSVDIGLQDVEQSFVLAYATTIHKMQGSQAKAIVIPMSMSYSHMLTRNLLYTAVTRAEKLCMIIGSEEAVKFAVRDRSVKPRNSSLAERLKHPSLSGQLL